MSRVSLEGLSKTYGKGPPAVRAVDLDIRGGEMIVLVGPSGCGKSTILRMIAGLEGITSGTLRIDDDVVNDVPPRDRDIAMVFQTYALYPQMTVYKNMAFGLMMRKTPRDEIDRKVREAARMLDLNDLLGRLPSQLSGGQRQRVALGRAIVRHPRVLLLDEPLSNLDAKLRLATRAELKRLHQRLGTTTVYVTHDQEEAMTLGDRIVVMSAGRGHGMIEQIDSPMNVFRHPANRFVADFIGGASITFLEGELKEQGGRLRFERDGFGVALPASWSARARGGSGPATLGVRAAAVSWRPVERDGERGPEFTATPEIIEPLGSQMDITARLPDQSEIRARCDVADIALGEPHQFWLDTAYVHLFEPGEFGINILNGEGES